MQQMLNTSTSSVPPKQWVHTRYQLLGQVEREVNHRLEQSLHKFVPVHDLSASQLAAKRLWDVEVKIGDQPSLRLVSDRSILEVFDLPSVAGQMLLLGAPGSGKTTTALELARELVTRAAGDERASVPVLLNLCAWPGRAATFAEWIVGELHAKYGLMMEVGRQWLENRSFVLILDGLNELKPEWQKACLKALDEFLRQRTPPACIVCSGLTEYAKGNTLLPLNAAVYLLPLTTDQVKDYLWSLGLQQLWQQLQADPHLLSFAKVPFFLNLIALAAEEIYIEEWRQRPSPEARCRYLLEAYVRRQLKSALGESRYDIAPGKAKTRSLQPQQVRHWLGWVAKWLKRAGTDEFIIEQMQPSWLPKPVQRWFYRLGVALILGALGGLSCGLSFGWHTGIVGFWVFGIFGGLCYDIELAEPLNWSWHKAKKGMVAGLSIGLVAGLVGGLFLAAIGELSDGWFGVIRATLGGLMGGLIFGSSQGLNDPEIKRRRLPNQGIWDCASTAGIFTVVSSLCFGLSFGLVGGVLRGIGGIGFGILAGLACGGIACIQHFTLRLILWGLGYAPWNYARLLELARSLRLMQVIGGRYRFTHDLIQFHLGSPLPAELVVRTTASQLVKTVAGHSDYVQAVAVSPDGRLVVSGSDDMSVKLWQVLRNEVGQPTLRPISTLSGHAGFVRTVAISPDGQLLASGSNDKSIRIWHLGAGPSHIPQGALLLTLAGHKNWVRAVAFSPNGQLLASCGDDNTINIWYLRTGQLLTALEGHTDYVRCLAFSPDGRMMASGSDDKTINLWRLDTEGRPYEQPLLTLEGHSGYVRTLAISSDGQILASGSDDQTITVWQLDSSDPENVSATPLHLLGGHAGLIWSVAISPDGRLLASSSRDKTIRLWNLETGELLRSIAVSPGWIFSIKFTPDGQFLIGGAQDQTVKMLPVFS